MATFNLGSIPSLVGQLAAAKQIEAQEQNILASQIAAATQQERLNQLQSPQNQALQQLQQQLQTATIQQQLKDLANPQGARLRAVQDALALKAVDPASGIIAAPAGLEGETIFTPRALTEAQQASLPGVFSAAPLTAGQREAFPDVSDVLPTVAPGAPISPLMLGGQPTGFSQDIARAAEVTEALSRAKGTTSLERQLLANAQSEANRLSREGMADKRISSAEKIAAGRTGAGKGLTANQQANYRLRGGRALVDINQYTDPATGQVDWDLYVTKVGEAEGNALAAGNVIKNARAATKTTLDEKNLQIYGNRMSQANDDFNKLTQAGFDPTSIGAEGLVGGWLPNLLKTDERQQYEQSERNFINSTLRRESGAVITDDEFANARKQYFPQPGDGQAVLDQKAANRKLVVDEFIRLGGQASATPPSSAPTGMIRVIKPDGTAGSIPAANLQNALKAGWKQAP